MGARLQSDCVVKNPKMRAMGNIMKVALMKSLCEVEVISHILNWVTHEDGRYIGTNHASIPGYPIALSVNSLTYGTLKVTPIPSARTMIIIKRKGQITLSNMKYMNGRSGARR